MVWEWREPESCDSSRLYPDVMRRAEGLNVQSYHDLVLLLLLLSLLACFWGELKEKEYSLTLRWMAKGRASNSSRVNGGGAAPEDSEPRRL